ncbi:MAG: glycosyltransferase [Candidatus Eisenbacteria bacterium]|nr:glycosyltransferase [Candidatus Eisenbacteria bacterium]
MDVLYASCEMVPLVKVGGLADVAGALTHALTDRGHRVRALLPLYEPVRERLSAHEMEAIGELTIEMGDGPVRGRVHRGRLPEHGAELLLLECARFFDRPDPYVDPATGRAWPDALLSHTFLCRGVLEVCRILDWAPEIVHLNDHQTALAAALLRGKNAPPALRQTATLLSIHNLGYQGIFPEDPVASGEVPRLLTEMGIGEALYRGGGPLAFHGRINLMKAGLQLADLITTVSPTYAREIQTDELGFGLGGLLRARADRLVGILNGIDTTRWDPLRDPLIPHNYGPSDFRGKERNKVRLLETMHLPPEPRVPLFGIVSRLVDQKGFDLLGEVLESALDVLDLRLVVLGTGQREHEECLQALARRFPDRLAVVIGFDEPLAHLIEAGSDFFLMPARYEPCGLNQMYSLRYGTVPVVHATGGLADTVEEFVVHTGRGNGIVFDAYTPQALRAAIERALALYRRTRAFKRLVAQIMRIDHSWGRAAEAHEGAYARARALRTAELEG